MKRDFSAISGGRWVPDGLVQVWRAWRADRPQCGIKDCTAVHVPWTGMPEPTTKGA